MSKAEDCYDLIIIGGGLAGMTAAVRALELGLRAVVIEKGEGESYPCNSRQSGGIMHIGFLDPYRPQTDLIEVINERCAGAADAALTATLAASGGRFLDWLQDKGARFVRFNELEGYRWCMAPPRALRAGIDWQGRGPDVSLRALVTRFEERGGRMCRGSRAESLLMDDDGCHGVVLESQGQEATIHGHSVLIADGGFQANAELYETHVGAEFARVFQRGARTGMGDGLTMALAAGAALKDSAHFYGHVLCSDAMHSDKVWPYPEIDAIATAGIVVNGAGQRIADEGISGVYLTNALAQVAAEQSLYAIFDAAIWEHPGQSARIPANPLLEGAGGTVLRADSLTALAALAGIAAPSLDATVRDYNAALTADTLEQLAIPRSRAVQAWPIVKPPFMAIPVCPGITYTMGGIAIDEHAQVLDEAGEPIKGLFAAGAATGGLEGGRNAAYIGGLMKAGVFGMLAAERVASLQAVDTRDDAVAAPTSPPSRPGVQTAQKAPPRPPRLAKYPMLHAILRFGKVAAVGLSMLVGALVLWLCWPSMGALAIPVAGVAALVSAALALSYTELVRLITDMLLPE